MIKCHARPVIKVVNILSGKKGHSLEDFLSIGTANFVGKRRKPKKKDVVTAEGF